MTVRNAAPYPSWGTAYPGPVCYGNEDPWRWFGWQYNPGPTNEQDLRWFTFHIKLGYAAGAFTVPAWAMLFESNNLPNDQRAFGRAMTIDTNDDVYVAYRRDDYWANGGAGLCIVQKLSGATGARQWVIQLGD